jgi:hypothetical protein
MTHRRKKQGRALPVAGNVLRFLPHLGHQHGITVAIQPGKRRHLRIELVAQDEQQLARAAQATVSG